MRPLALAVLLVLLAVPALAQSGDEVLVARIDGVVTQGTALYIADAVREAEDRGAPLVIVLDTPGGLVDATLDMDRVLADAEVPVLTFVGPRSAYAASAGTFLFLMGQPNGMAPGTTIGSAQPVTVSPTGETEEAGEKVENFLVGRIRQIAERTGRDPDIAERFITDNLNLDRDQARDAGMVDVLAEDLASFVRAVDGFEARTASGSWALDTGTARLVEYRPGLLPGLVDLLSNPQIAFLLILVGTYTLIFGLANPGTYVPETLGALFLLGGFVGLGLFGTSTAGILFLVLALVFFVAEVFTTTNGFLTVMGVVSLVLAVLFLVDEPLLPGTFLRRFYFVGIATALATAGVVFGAMALALKAQRRPVHDVLRGARATVLEALDPEGRVAVHGEVWQARTDSGPVPVGGLVVVTAHEGLLLHVRPEEDGGPESDGEE